MLDENLPAFFIRPTSDDPLQSTVFLGQGGEQLNPEYTFRRPNPSDPGAQNCYAIALADPHNKEVIFAEVLVQPEWTQPTLSQAEIRANNGISPPPIPIVPNKFTIQLYNPDQQIIVKQIAGSWNSSSYWEFEFPQQTFRKPSASTLDRAQDDPAASALTPKVTFKWKKDGKLTKDITCYLAGKSTDGKKSKEPDITIAMFRKGKELTLYEPNMQRVEVEDTKGLEVVILLGACVIRDVFFEASREMFNITPIRATVRKNSAPGANSRKKTPSPPAVVGAYPGVFPPGPPPPVMTGAKPISRPAPPHAASAPTNPTLAYQAEQDMIRLREEAREREREKEERRNQKRLKKMLEEEDRERRRREAEIEKETERLRKQYGIPPAANERRQSRPTVHFSPPLPARPVPLGPPQPPRPYAYSQGSHSQSRQSLYNQAQPLPPQQMPQYFSAPHTRPAPAPRPQSVPNAQSGPFHSKTLNNVCIPITTCFK